MKSWHLGRNVELEVNGIHQKDDCTFGSFVLVVVQSIATMIPSQNQRTKPMFILLWKNCQTSYMATV